jgi:4-amino-4-deoxy-L-arabinose transferase-like glycosyltransferase
LNLQLVTLFALSGVFKYNFVAFLLPDGTMSLFTGDRQPERVAEISVLVLLLAAAAFFRFTQLSDVPPGMTHDEAAFGAEAEWILSGQRPIYFALGYGHEPLYAYLVAGVFTVLGRTLLALRITSALCGMLVVGFTYLVARRMFGAHTAWVAAAWMAVAFWPVSLSRQALRAITLPMVWLPAALLFWGGLKVAGSRSVVADRPRGLQLLTFNLKLWAIFASSGLYLGASFYTYMASRLTWLVFPLFALYLLLHRETRRVLRWAWPGMVLTLAVAGLVALPLALYLYAHPASEIRVGLMMEPVRELLAGKPDRALGHAWNAVRVFSWVGDRFWAYNIPGQPVFGWTGSSLFYLGLAVALWRTIRCARWQDAGYAFLILWLLVGLAPAMVTTNEGIFLRAIVAQPATYVLVAVGMCTIGRVLLKIGTWLKISEQSTAVAWNVLATALIMLEADRMAQAYFIDWPARPEVRNIYNHNLVAASRYLADSAWEEDVAVSALYPLYYHDPWIFRYVAGREDLRTRWFDGRGAIVHPLARTSAKSWTTYVFSALTPLHPALRGEFEAQATLVERRELSPEDENPAFEVWRWQGQDALAERLEGLEAVSPTWVSPEVQFKEPEQRRPLDGPAPFGDLVTLVGYRIEGQNAGPEEGTARATLVQGETVTLVTYWRALRTAVDEDDWKTFVHLLDAGSQVIGGVDVLNAPPTGWLPGDVIVQVHTFRVDADASPGEAYLEVGVYRDETGRLPVIVEGEAAGDRVLLAPVTIER